MQAYDEKTGLTGQQTPANDPAAKSRHDRSERRRMADDDPLGTVRR